MDVALFPNESKHNTLTTDDRNALVLSCERLCASIARRQHAGCGNAIELEDLVQEALVACMEASKRWHPDRGVKFITYCTPCIERHLKNLINKARAESAIRPESWDSIADPKSCLGLDDEEIAAELQLSPAQVEALNRLDERSREAVILTLEGTAPDRLAERLGLPSVKDAKLLLRNAAAQLRRGLAWANSPSLFDIGGEADAA